MKPTRVIFFGTPEFAVPTLLCLIASPCRVVAAVSQPDRPRGRGQRVVDGPVKQAAGSAGIPVLQPERLRDEGFAEAFSGLSPDIAVVAAYGKILSEWLLAIPPFGFVNVHASLLPRYRGAAPIQRAVMAGEAETGVSIMRIVRELDAGPVFATGRTPIGPDETADQVEHRLAGLGAGLLLEVLPAIVAGTARESPQDHALATYAPRIAREDGLIDWSRPALAIHNQVRGLHPWPHAFTFAGADRFIVHRTTLAPTSAPLAIGTQEAYGTIVVATGDHLAVAAGDGQRVWIQTIQTEGRRPMPVREFLAGHRLQPGQRLSSR